MTFSIMLEDQINYYAYNQNEANVFKLYSLDKELSINYRNKYLRTTFKSIWCFGSTKKSKFYEIWDFKFEFKFFWMYWCDYMIIFIHSFLTLWQHPTQMLEFNFV